MEKFFLNSLPKAGTNLLVKLVDLLGYKYKTPGIAATLLLGKHYLIRQIIRGAKWEKNPVIIGLDLPVAISEHWLRKKISSLKKGEYITGHANYSDHLYFLLQENNIKIIQVIRDPRDVLVSYIHYVAKTPSHFIYDFYKNLTFDERLKFTLFGGKAKDKYIESFPEMLKKVDGWFDKKNVLVVKFEDIIGGKGGGSNEIQLQKIKIICEFLEIENPDIKNITDNLFGGTPTFRKGKIGSWKEELNKKQIKLVEKVIGGIVGKWGYK